MKTFSKIVSVVLIAVMCFSLLATSAYAFDETFSLDGSGSSNSFSFSTSDTASYGGGFGDDVFSLGDSVVTPTQSNPVSVAQTESNSQDFQLQTKDEGFSLGEKTESVDTVKEDDELLFTRKDSDVLKEAWNNQMTFSASPTSVTLPDITDGPIKISASGGTLDTDTFDYFMYDTTGAGTGATRIPNSGYSIASNTLTLLASWLKTLAPNTYHIYGAWNSNKLPVEMCVIRVNPADPSDYGTFTAAPSTYEQYKEKDENPYKSSVSVVADSGNSATQTLAQFVRFAVIPQGSSNGTYADGYINMHADKKTMTFSRTFLDGLKAGYYDIYGITSNGVQVKLGSMYIKGGNGASNAAWTLSPDYGSFVWTSGDDILWFWSSLMARRNEYPGRVVVVRYGIGAGSIPNKTVDVNQYWDVQTQPGTFGLGTNFLSSLSAGTYTLQVVDLKTLDCTNIVTFRIGSTLKAIDTDKHVIGSIKNLRFLCDEAVAEVYVGNIPLTYGEDYALSNNGKTITLSFEFLNKRSAGNTYTIKALTYSGTYPSTTFQILSSAQGSASPRTGDESNLGLWAAFLLLSGTAVVVLVPKLRKYDF